MDAESDLLTTSLESLWRYANSPTASKDPAPPPTLPYSDALSSPESPGTNGAQFLRALAEASSAAESASAASVASLEALGLDLGTSTQEVPVLELPPPPPLEGTSSPPQRVARTAPAPAPGLPPALAPAVSVSSEAKDERRKRQKGGAKKGEGSGSGGGAKLSQLGRKEKAKLARLIQELSHATGREQLLRERLARLRSQNEDIIAEMAAQKSKFNKSLQLLQRYQVKLLEVESSNSRLRADLSGGEEALKEGRLHLERKLQLEAELKQLQGSYQELIRLHQRERESAAEEKSSLRAEVLRLSSRAEAAELALKEEREESTAAARLREESAKEAHEISASQGGGSEHAEAQMNLVRQELLLRKKAALMASRFRPPKNEGDAKDSAKDSTKDSKALVKALGRVRAPGAEGATSEVTSLPGRERGLRSSINSDDVDWWTEPHVISGEAGAAGELVRSRQEAANAGTGSESDRGRPAVITLPVRGELAVNGRLFDEDLLDLVQGAEDLQAQVQVQAAAYTKAHTGRRKQARRR